MHLQLLAISDTHLGEETPLLSYPAGRQALCSALLQTFGKFDGTHWDDRETFEVDQLVLLGDAPDRTLSSTSNIVTHTNGFTEALVTAAQVKKWVYVPGNHDHTTWTHYCDPVKDLGWGVTPAVGTPIATGAAAGNGPAHKYLETLFGYPAGLEALDLRHKALRSETQGSKAV